MVDLEGVGYIGPIIPVSLANLVAGRQPSGEVAPNSGGGSRTNKTLPKVAATGGSAQVKALYDAHLPSLSLQYGDNFRSILAGSVLPTLHIYVMCKNWHLCVVCWEDCERKNFHTPNPP